ncbi:serine acetyltransferase [Maribacter sp. MJ134]|nr:serine acetyltransferase [Maribacter sp. MJ134]
MPKIIESDLFRYIGAINNKAFRKALKIPGFKCTYALKKIQNSKRIGFYDIYYRIKYLKYLHEYRFQIPNYALTGKDFYISHFGNIVINGKAKIGKWCNVSQGVTIAETNRGVKKGAPIICDKVWIGPNSVIVGKVVIGSNVLIAPLTYVNIDIPDNSIVMGNPCKIVTKLNAIENYINNILN